MNTHGCSIGCAAGGKMFTNLEIHLIPVILDKNEQWIEERDNTINRWRITSKEISGPAPWKFFRRDSQGLQYYKGFITCGYQWCASVLHVLSLTLTPSLAVTRWNCHQQCFTSLGRGEYCQKVLHGLHQGITGKLSSVQQILMEYMFKLCFNHLYLCETFRRDGIRQDVQKRICMALKFFLKAEKEAENVMFGNLSSSGLTKVLHDYYLNTYQRVAGDFDTRRNAYMTDLKNAYKLLRRPETGLGLVADPESIFNLQDRSYPQVVYRSHRQCTLCQPAANNKVPQGWSLR